MKKNLLLLTFLINASVLSAQSFVWAKNVGGTSLDNGLSVTTDASGNVYTTGYFQGTGDFDPGAGISNLTSVGGTDIFISKLNSAGSLIWVKQIGGPVFDMGRCIKVDASGNVYTTGNFGNSVDFNPGAGTFSLTTSGANDIFVSKLDASGNFVWAKKIGGSTSDYGYSLDLDASGNVYVTGAFEGTVDFDPGAATFNLVSSGALDIFVSKLDVNGNFVWAKSIGSTTQDFGMCLTLDASGDVYTAGYFEGVADFDPSLATYTLSSTNARDIFISKLNASGNFVWAKKIGGGGNQIANAITTDALGNVYTTGDYVNTVDFDPGAGSYTLTTIGLNTNIFVSKLDASGNFVWAKEMGSSGNDYGRGITIDASGNVLTTGEFSGTVDFDPNGGTTNLVGIGAVDFFISKLDAFGNFVAAKNIGSPAIGTVGNAISTDAGGNIYTTGLFSGITDFDPDAGVFNLTAPGTQSDVFVLKLNSIGTSINETTIDFEIIVYPNPTSFSINIKTAETIETIYVYNLLGAVVMKEKNNSFSVEQLPAGVYTLQIKTQNGMGTTRFVKE